MLALGFGSGLPLLLVFSTQSAWLREAGVSRTDIGLMSYVALAYTFKFLWAPIIDAVNVPVLAPRLGRRRAWMLLAQAGVVVGLVGIAFGDPAHSLIWTIVCAFFVAFNGATQDVVVDAWRIDSAPVERQGLMAATYQLGYSIALVCAGAGALYIADFVNWKSAYFAMAALMAVGMAACLLAPRLPDRATSLQGDRAARLRSLAASFVGPVIDLIRRQGPLLVPILALVAVYRLPDFVYGVMANPLYIDLGFTKSEIATVSKIYGVWVGVAGAIGGGFAVSRLGLMPALFIGGVAASASHLTSAWLASSGARVDLLTFAVSLQSFASGFAGTALIAYMSSLTSPLFAATQYALLSSLYALPGKLVGGLSGVMVDRFGYPIFFVLTSAIGIPVMLLSLLVWRSISKTQYLSEEAEPAPM
ncbi:MAG: MFS transporter [Methylobacteriaceae bacterium]|nr:MFS transporter [Methylobacteriaceae bacterium]MBV9246383.1 MFS transporter [Methylobacteriaceae bacterium]